MELKNDYQPEGNYYDKYHSANPIVKWMMGHYFADLQELLPEKRKGIRILEAGCGEGEVSGFVAKHYGDACSLDAFDVSESVIAKAKEEYPNIRFDTGNIYEMTKEGYDLVLCCEVLEHLTEPEKALWELERVTSEYLIVSVPREPIWRILNMLRGKYWADLGNTPGHIQHWSKKKFLLFLQKIEMEIVCVKSPFPWTMVLLKKKRG